MNGNDDSSLNKALFAYDMLLLVIKKKHNLLFGNLPVNSNYYFRIIFRIFLEK